VIRHPLSTHRTGADKNNNNKLSFAIYRLFSFFTFSAPPIDSLIATLSFQRNFFSACLGFCVLLKIWESE